MACVWNLTYWRLKLRDYIIEHKLTDDSWKGRLAAEGFGLIAAIILVGGGWKMEPPSRSPRGEKMRDDGRWLKEEG